MLRSQGVVKSEIGILQIILLWQMFLTRCVLAMWAGKKMDVLILNLTFRLTAKTPKLERWGRGQV